MGYQKQNFVDCQVLNSAQLNHIEDHCGFGEQFKHYACWQSR